MSFAGNSPRAALALLLLAGLAADAQAESIWARRSQRFAFLFNDNRARHIGDTLTLILIENTAINQREQRQLTKATQLSEVLEYAGSSSSDGTSRKAAANIDFSNQSNRTFNGNAQLTSNRVLSDRMGVSVIDVLPNGNLVIEGHRIRIVSGERRIMRVTGIVRPADLSPGNTIFSETVANLKIEYLGRGTDTEFTNQGWLGRFFNVIWPF